MKPRHHLYLDDELTNELEHLAAKPGASKSAIVTAALRQYLKHKGGDDRDDALRTRLDRLSRHQLRTERDMDLIIETLTRLVRTYLLLTSHIPTPDEAGRAQARARYDQFINEVGRAMASHDETRLSPGKDLPAATPAAAAE
jgi:hypothetical protein